MITHLSAEEIAELAEGTLTRDRTTAFRTHLAGCPACAAAWADAVRDRATWLGSHGQLELPGQVAAELARDSGATLVPSPAPVASRRWLLAAAAATAIVLAGSWMLFPSRATPALGLELPPEVRASIESSSARELVLPGGERHADHATAEMRSGAGSSSPGLTLELDELTSRYESGARTAVAGARLVAALIATSDLEAADAYAREVLRAHPRDVRILVLMAELGYRASDLSAAERHLRSASEIAPRDPLVCLDLALVLRERGDTLEAKQRFERVAASGPRALAERAKRELGR